MRYAQLRIPTDWAGSGARRRPFERKVLAVLLQQEPNPDTGVHR